MKFRPLHDRVVVRRVEQEEKTSGGIIIPDTAKEKPMEGEVVAVGPGARGEDGTLHPLDVKPGDRVLFGKWSGTEIKLDGEDLMIMKESRSAKEIRLWRWSSGVTRWSVGSSTCSGVTSTLELIARTIFRSR